MLIVAFISAILSGYFGLFLSYHASLATSPAIVLVLGLLYITSLLFGRQGGLLFKNRN